MQRSKGAWQVTGEKRKIEKNAAALIEIGDREKLGTHLWPEHRKSRKTIRRLFEIVVARRWENRRQEGREAIRH